MTIAGQRHDLPQPFHVLATQNPIELEGTFPLPEAQLDRFLMQIDVLYPDVDAERRMLFETTGAEEAEGARRAERRRTDGGAAARSPHAGRRSGGRDYPEAGALAAAGGGATSVGEQIAWGPGPRASQALMLTVRARALLDGRFAPSLDDVEALAIPTLQHRMAVTFAARASEGVTVQRSDFQRAEGRPLADGRCLEPAPEPVHASKRRWRLPRACRSCSSRRRRIAANVMLGVHGRRHPGPGETFWQFRPLRPGRADPADRLAPLGARRPSLCARTRMGGLADGMALGGPVAVDGFPLARCRRRRSSTAPSC